MKPKFTYSALKRFRPQSSIFLTVCLGLAAAGSRAQAETRVLSSGSTGLVTYNQGGTWESGIVPNGADDVIVDRSTGSTADILRIGTSSLQQCYTLTFGSDNGPALGDFNFRGGSTGTSNRRIRINSGVLTVHPSVTGTIFLGIVPNGNDDTNAQLLSNFDNTVGFSLVNNSPTQTLRSQMRLSEGRNLTLTSAGGEIVVDTYAPGWDFGAPFASLNGGSGVTSLTNSDVAGLRTISLSGTGAHSFAGRIEDTSTVASTAQLALDIDNTDLTQTLTGANTFSGGTIVANGMLIATSPAALGTGDVFVDYDGLLLYRATTADPLEIGGDLTISGGGYGSVGTYIGSALASSTINVTGAATIAGGGEYIDIHGEEGVTHANGLVTLIQGGAGSDLTGAEIGYVYNNTDFTVSGFTANMTEVQATITAAAEMTSAYWTGDLSGILWAVSDGTTSNWSATAGDPSLGLIPGPGADVIISATSPTNPPVLTQLGANMSFKSLTIDDTANGLGLEADGFTLTLGNDGLTMNAGVPASTIAANVALGTSQTWTNNSGDLLTVSGELSEASAGLDLTKDGTGTLVLAGAGTFSGTTTISGGTLELGESAFDSVSIVDNANLTFNRAGTGAYSGSITGTGTVTKSGDGTQILNGANNYGGTTLVDAGILTFANTASLYNGNTASWTSSNINVKSGATMALNLGGIDEFETADISALLTNLATSSSPTNGMNAGSSLGFDTTNAAGHLLITDAIGDTTGASGGSRGIAKLGAGVLTLSGANSYSGTTSVNGGTLTFPSTSSLYSGNDASWTAANINVKAGATLAVNSGGAGEFDATTLGTLLANLATSDTETDGMNAGSNIGIDTTNSGGTFTLGDVLADTTGLAGGARGLTKLGTGTLALTAANTFSGVTTISGGTLRLGDGTDGNDGTIAASPDIINNGSLIYNRFGDTTYGGWITGTGSLSKTGAGALTLNGENTYAGVTAVTNGTLVAGTASMRGTSAVNVSPGATYQIGGVNVFVNGHGALLEDSRVITVDAGTLFMDANADTRFGNITLTNGSTWTSDRGLGAWDALLGNTTAGAAIINVTGTGAATMNGGGGIHLQGVQDFNVEDTTGSPAVDLDVSMILGAQGNIGGDAGGVHKTGAGTMQLAAANAYTGATIIDAGMINLTGSITSAVAVNSGGAMNVAGTGSAASSVTVNSGGSLSGSGSINDDVLISSDGHFAADIAATPGAQVPLNINGLMTLLGGNILDLTAASPPANGVYTLATSSLGVAYVAGTVNLTGVTGTVSVSGNSLILTVGSGSDYDAWADGFLPGHDVSDMAGDNDNDSLLNEDEYAFGLDPTSGASANPIPVQLDKGTGTFSYTRRDPALSGLTYAVWTSTNLGDWSEDTTADQAAGATDGDGNQTVVVTLTTPPTDPEFFVRVLATKP